VIHTHHLRYFYLLQVPFGHGTATRKVNAALHILRFTPDWSKVHAACGSVEPTDCCPITTEAIARE